jgi:hypothetical protein
MEYIFSHLTLVYTLLIQKRTYITHTIKRHEIFNSDPQHTGFKNHTLNNSIYMDSSDQHLIGSEKL